jgi:signal transduction histidine kinase
VARVNETYHANARTIQQARSDIQATRLLVRDYLLEPTEENSIELQEKMRAHKARILDQILKLEPLGDASVLDRLRASFDQYCASIEPLLEWKPDKNLAQSYAALRRQVQPRREDVVELLEEMQTLNDAALKRDVQRIAQTEEQFTASLKRMMIASALLGIVVALVSVRRIHLLERRNEMQHRRTEQAEQEMRRLSQQLVHAQEDERRSISRELHDEVGQMLTGLRMELKAISKLYGASPSEFQARIEQGRRVVEQTLQSVRDLAMGLRPSMLDDLGLEAAIRWQVREFARRHDIAVDLSIDCDLTNLPDQHRTNLYRVLQEALTNCARHSSARSVNVEMASTECDLRLTVRDDGLGMADRTASSGLGLIGMQERVRELGGSMSLESRPGRGTSLTVAIPVSWRETESERTSTAC